MKKEQASQSFFEFGSVDVSVSNRCSMFTSSDSINRACSTLESGPEYEILAE